ncbi:MAG: thioredoxin family protein [Candidatus Delongbacteria bacterium]|jgi:small redox-active disulfide protein 2|nr:thioredoxin family protein [Candidatus Delongbacteria bacterium]
MDIKILGTGCPKCKTLEKKIRESVDELGIDASIEKVEDIMKIMEYGVMQTPGMVIDGKVVFSGRLPSSKELNDMLTKKQ